MSRLNWIPNIFSTMRILLALVFPFAPPHLHLHLIGLAFASEFLDGWLARRYNWTSLSGQVLDPVADKLFTLAAGITFILADRLSLTQLLLISARDLTAASGFFLWLLLQRKNATLADFRPQMSGKVTTVFQYLVFIDLTLSHRPHEPLILLTGFLSVVAAVTYCYKFRAALR